MTPRFFKNPKELRSWLAENHKTSSSLQIGFYKKSAKKAGITYAEALDEALCFGWIDGVRHGIDAERYTIRFTPRRPGSIWSVVNTRRAEELKAAGLMKPPGLAAFDGRDAEKTKKYSYEVRSKLVLDAKYVRRFQSNRKAWDFFQSRTPRYRELASWWVMGAKKGETQLRRLDELIACSERGERPSPFLVSRASKAK
ncbi:MAG TPA: YdeI/OmpD-associated family protein [Vicinamibacteria bacterium]|nr:YdeI/OmpD-associated family protein [Vicinamibacteria bacterium]